MKSRVLSIGSLIATAATSYADGVADTMTILYYGERSAMSVGLFQASLALAVLALIFERPRGLALSALMASLLIAGGGQLRSGHGGGHRASQESCAVRQRELLARLREKNVLQGNALPDGFEGLLTAYPPAVAAVPSTWDLGCVGEPLTLVNRARVGKTKLVGVNCVHGVMTTLDGHTFLLPAIPGAKKPL